MPALAKNWDEHVSAVDEVSRGRGFLRLRDQIIELASPSHSDVVLDLGAGTGLLTLPVAEQAEIVWAIDISPAMCDRLRARAAGEGLSNINVVVASAVSLPLADSSVDVVVSNYCFHHLRDRDKERALSEVFRVLRPGGRLVFADMMFRVGLVNSRDRTVILTKVVGILAKGPAGLMRLAKNLARYLSGRWEQPARADWWQAALGDTGFAGIEVRVLEHEGGLASARRP